SCRKHAGCGASLIRDRVDPLRWQFRARPPRSVVHRLEQAFSEAAGIHRSRLRAIEPEGTHAGYLQAAVQRGPPAATVVRPKRPSPAEGPLPRVDEWKVWRGRHPGDVRTSFGIHGDGLDVVRYRSPDPCRVGERSRRLELDDE